MAGFAEAGDQYWLYDINPAVVNLSADEVAQFTYCINARDRGASVEIVSGDARLAMERELRAEKNRQLDVLVLDAFSSDSIPVHLLTLESLKLYDQHLKPDGVLAIHISNRYLNLEPVVRRLAAELDFGMIEVDSLGGEDYGQDWVYAATWVLSRAIRIFWMMLRLMRGYAQTYRKLGNCRCGPMIMRVFYEL